MALKLNVVASGGRHRDPGPGKTSANVNTRTAARTSTYNLKVENFLKLSYNINRIRKENFEMERVVSMILLTLERLSILKEYELHFLTEDEALERLQEITKVMNEMGVGQNV